MKKKWYTERKWESNGLEIEFEKLLKENGFNVVGLKEYMSKTDYLIEKDGIRCEFTIQHIDNKKRRATLCYKNFIEYYNIKVEYERLKSQVEKQ